MRKLDMAWINGNIYTADDKFSTVAAFGVSGDRFSVVGSTEEVLENCDEHTKIIDLQGKTVLPGLIDAHLHITNTGAMKLNLNLVSKQKQEILDMVADAYSSAKKGEWIIGRGWINDTWDDPSFPSKEDLDAVAPDSPVYLTRACGHAAWANTKAFETAGITKDTPDPAGGEFLHKQDGSLLGVVTDQAQDPFNKAIPSYTKEQIQKIVLLAQQEFFSNGLTSVQDRYTGHQRALQEYGLDIDLDNLIVIRPSKYERQGSMEEIYAVAHKFTAFMCCSDYYAVTLMKYLKAKGIRFPEDLSITGFDDNLYAQLACPSLTTIHQDIFQRGTIAAEYLFKMIDGWNPKTTNLSLPVRLVVRDSVKLLNPPEDDSSDDSSAL